MRTSGRQPRWPAALAYGGRVGQQGGGHVDGKDDAVDLVGAHSKHEVTQGGWALLIAECS